MASDLVRFKENLSKSIVPFQWVMLFSQYADLNLLLIYDKIPAQDQDQTNEEQAETNRLTLRLLKYYSFS
jgi:hypothetical protein